MEIEQEKDSFPSKITTIASNAATTTTAEVIQEESILEPSAQPAERIVHETDQLGERAATGNSRYRSIHTLPHEELIKVLDEVKIFEDDVEVIRKAPVASVKISSTPRRKISVFHRPFEETYDITPKLTASYAQRLNCEADSTALGNGDSPYSEGSETRESLSVTREMSIDKGDSIVRADCEEIGACERNKEDKEGKEDKDSCGVHNESNVLTDSSSSSSSSSPGETRSSITGVSSKSESPAEDDGKLANCNTTDTTNSSDEKRQRFRLTKRSVSESDVSASSSEKKCRCRNNRSQDLFRLDESSLAFPSLTDERLQESGIANLSRDDLQAGFGENLSESELERKYTALSIGLSTDRLTLRRRADLALRQRDQSERNLTGEVHKMQQYIQELAPLCTDRESIERVERVRHQLDMITKCAHRATCAAETLGAVQQEDRVSRAVLLADRYLQVLRCRCEKLAADVAETKRILIENNVPIEENTGELTEDLPRIRYRSGAPTNNRIMMARRRASIAAILRPLGTPQEVLKDGVRQRNSVSGRVTFRRPSLSYESQKWDTEKLDRTDSSSSIGELREIFEQAESRRESQEENNNVLGINQIHNLNTNSSANSEVWMNAKHDTFSEIVAYEDANENSKICVNKYQSFIRTNCLPWRSMVWCVIIFFFGFYMNYAISSVNKCNASYKWWSVEEILKTYIPVGKKALPPT